MMSANENTFRFPEDEGNQLEMISERKSEKNSSSLILRNASSKKFSSKSLRSIFPHRYTCDNTKLSPRLIEWNNEENVAHGGNSISKNDTSVPELGHYAENEAFKYDLKSLNNSQRILLGLKVASMKCRPVNMHQFENKKKVDVGYMITSIVHTLVSECNHNDLTGDNISRQEQKRAKRPISRIGSGQFQDLRNLSRGALSNFRHDVATSENKKRVKKFMDIQL